MSAINFNPEGVLINNETVINATIKIFSFKDKFGSSIFEALIRQKEIIDIYFGLIQYDEIVFMLIDIIKNIHKPEYNFYL